MLVQTTRRKRLLAISCPIFPWLHSARKWAAHFVVVDDAEQLRGMISLEDLELPEDDFMRNLVLIEDMVVDDVKPLDAEDNLHEALQKLLDSGYDKLPVVRRDEHGKRLLMGYMMHRDLMRIYHEEVEALEDQE